MKQFIILVIVLLASMAFYQYGRAIYMPIVYKIKGKETLQSITAKLERQPASRIAAFLADTGFQTYPKELILIGLKEEQMLQVYGQDDQGPRLIKEYPFTAISGVLGPKLKEGDKQIPEGIYGVEYLNPNSAYHLSIKVNYPNEFDKSKTKFDEVNEMGGDIFIHGKAASIGCIAIGDRGIEEVFLLVSKADLSKVTVVISPRDFRINHSYPVIRQVEWAQELYDLISAELQQY